MSAKSISSISPISRNDGTSLASMKEPSGMRTGPEPIPIDALKKLANDSCSSPRPTPPPSSAIISSAIPLSHIISRKKASSIPDDRNSSRSKSAMSASPVASYIRRFSPSDRTAYACRESG
eukprot:scaffold33246_cov73-Isochrysis_galbana.AAC.2